MARKRFEMGETQTELGMRIRGGQAMTGSICKYLADPG